MLIGGASGDTFVWNAGDLGQAPTTVIADATGGESFGVPNFWGISFDSGAGDFIEQVVITLSSGNFDPGTTFPSFGPVFDSGVGLVEGDVTFTFSGGNTVLTIDFDSGTGVRLWVLNIRAC